MNMTKKNGHIYLTPKSGKYTHVIIFLHGFGDGPNSYVDFFEQGVLPKGISAKIILLQAPTLPTSMAGGMPMPSWFDITKFPIDSEKCINFSQAQNSSKILENIINEEAKLLNGKYENIFIGGFSQGACLSLYTGYTFNHLLGGVLCCSGCLFPQTKILPQNLGLKVFVGHGTDDDVIPFDTHKLSIAPLGNTDNITKCYYQNMHHTIDQKEVNDIKQFLQKYMK